MNPNDGISMENEISQEFKQHVEAELKQHRNAARLYTCISSVLFLSAISASVLASMNVTAELIDKTSATIVAAIPAAVALLTSTFKFNERARWHQLKKRRLEAFHHELVFQRAEAGDVSRRMNAALEELEKIRPITDAPG